MTAAGIERIPRRSREQWLSERQKDVTASVAAAMFGPGIHPYVSPLQLYALKSGAVVEDPEDTPLFKRGRLLEPVIIELLREERPDWTVTSNTDYFRETATRIGATPDTFVTRPDIAGTGTVQLKSVGKWAFEKGWKVDGEVQFPAWIGIQAATEAALTGATWAAVAAMGIGDGGLDLYVEEFPIRPALIKKVRALAAEFWQRIAEKRPYEADYGKDAAAIAALYNGDEGGEVYLDAPELVAMLDDRAGFKATEAAGTAAEKSRKELDLRLRVKMGNASTAVLPDGRRIEVKTIRRAGYSVAPSQYSQLRVKENGPASRSSRGQLSEPSSF